VSVENEIREFLTSRRARVTPERAGLPKWGRHLAPHLHGRAGLDVGTGAGRTRALGRHACEIVSGRRWHAGI